MANGAKKQVIQVGGGGGGGSGTVTNVSSTTLEMTVATPTTTPALTIVSAPKLTTARTINGVAFDGTANIVVVDATKQVSDAGLTSLSGLTGAGYVKATATDTFSQVATIPNTDITGLGTLSTQSGTFSGASSGTNTGDQSLFSTVAVAGQVSVVADATTDTLTLVAGTNVTITTDATTDAITISATGGGVTNLTYTASPTNGIVVSDTGTDATIPLGNGTNAGLSLNDYTTAEKTKLSGIATGATANSSDATLLARANHTGSQLASTISDFASTVRATVLTGLSLISTTVISATDTVLVALGSLQAQITSLTTTVAGKVDSVTAGANITVTGTATAPIVNTPTMTATVGGAVPTPPNSATQFLNGTGVFSTPAGGGVVAPVTARIRRSTNQSIATGAVFIDLSFDTSAYQVNGTFWTTGATVTIPETGYFQIFTEATFEGAAVAVTCDMQVLVNGTLVIGSHQVMAGASATVPLSVMSQRLFTAGDTIKVQVKHSNATALNIFTEGDHSPDIIVTKLTGAKGDAGAPGSSATKGIAEVDFGAITQENDTATVTVPSATITATSYPSVTMYGIATPDHDPDDYVAEGLTAYVTNIVVGVSFDIMVNAPNLTWGKYKVTYLY